MKRFVNFRFFVLSLPLFLAGALFLFRRFGINLPWRTDSWLAEFLLDLSTVVQSLLGVYGINSFYLLYVSYKHQGAQDQEKERPRTMKEWSGPWPIITVQLPIYNERYVIKRLIELCVKFDWPVDKLEIQVLDDSDDGTEQIVQETIEQLRKHTKVKLVHLRRANREGFKAGALKVGLAQAAGEFIAIFDADFAPEADFLMKTVPRFLDAKVACVQTRWDHLNADYSLMTAMQAIGHDGHFIVEQFAKCKSGHLFNFNGTGGLWRKAAIMDAGDWSPDTLAEDLDLSYRAQLNGWKLDYLRDVTVPAEVPLTITAFKKQQARWARGSMQTALKLAKRIWDSDILSGWQKLESTIHLFAYSVHPLMYINLVLTLILYFVAPHRTTDMITYFVMFVAVGPPMTVATAQLVLERHQKLWLMPCLVVLHHGMCMNNSLAVIRAFTPGKGIFERTPKFGSLQERQKYSDTSYFKQLRVNIPWPELVMLVLLLASLAAGMVIPDLRVNTASYPWLAFFALGFLSIIVLHLQELCMKPE